MTTSSICSPFDVKPKTTLSRAVKAGVSFAGVGLAASAAVPGVASAKESLVHQGSQGDSVKTVQRALGERPTGYFGPHTRADVVSFQQNHGLEVDGIVGPQTRGAMFGSGGDAAPSHNSKRSSVGGGSKATYQASSRHSSSSASARGSAGGSVPSYIVQCESGGNYHAVNPSTGAGGAYQIMPSTWRAYGGSGSPQTASKAQQDQIASKIYKSQGSSPWSCAK